MIAARAGVSVQTVLRQFGTRDAVLAAAAERGRAAVLAERSIDPDDLTATLGALVDHHELRGDSVLLLLAQEPREPIAADVTSAGKQLHRTWVEATFTRQLRLTPGAARMAVIDQLASPQTSPRGSSFAATAAWTATRRSTACAPLRSRSSRPPRNRAAVREPEGPPCHAP